MAQEQSEFVQIYDTTSVEEAHRMCNAGWVVRSITKGQYQNGDGSLIFSLGWKHRDKSPPDSRRPPEQMGSSDHHFDDE